MKIGTLTPLLALAALAAVARADTTPPEVSALGWQVEHADLVVLAVVREGSFTVTEAIRGDAAVGADLEVRLSAAADRSALRPGFECLLFLVEQDGAWTPAAGRASIRVLPAMGPGRRQLEMTRALAGALDEPERTRELLLGWMEDPEPGMAWSAATDFVRREDLHRDCPPAAASRVLAAFLSHPAGKAGKDALALAVSVARPAGAAAALIEALAGPSGGAHRNALGTALVRLAAPEAPALLAAAVSSTEAETRARLVGAVGRLAAPESLGLLRKLLIDPEVAVRVEAAHALGLVARAIREREPGEIVAGRVELVGLLAAAGTGNELEAALWALAQLDDPRAFAVLRQRAEEDRREFVRRHARRYLERPRLSLILD